jgi:hypothetical protein
LIVFTDFSVSKRVHVEFKQFFTIMAPKTIVRASTYDRPDVVHALGVFGWVIMTIINPHKAHAYAVGEYIQIQGHKKSMVNWKYGKIVKSEECAPNKYRIVVAQVEPRPVAEWNPDFPKGVERAKRGCSIIFEIPPDEIIGKGSTDETGGVYTLPTGRRNKPDVVPRRVPEPTAEAVAYVIANEVGVLPPVAQPEIQPAPAVVPVAIQPEDETPYHTPDEFASRGRGPLVARPNNENRLSLSPIGRMVAAPFKYGHRAYVMACANSKLRTLKAAVQKNQTYVEAMNAEIACNNEEYDEEEARVNEYLRKANATRVRKNANLTKSIEANTTQGDRRDGEGTCRVRGGLDVASIPSPCSVSLL